jgi:hypothetical protein
VTPETRQRAAFELLRFTAVPVGSGIAVVELEGRFVQRGRFTREPLLVVERGGDESPGGRLELAPVRSGLASERFTGVYAVPADALDDGRFALGVRGTLLDLPAPDRPDDGARLAALAREANGLRRALELAEADSARVRAEAAAAAAETGEAERIAELERDVAEAREAAAAQRAEAEQAVADARAEAAAERAEVLAEREAALAELRERAEAAGAGTDVLRAELAEERDRSQAQVAELQERLAALQADREGEGDKTIVAPVRADPEPDDATDTYDLPAAAITRPRPVADRGASAPVVDPVHHPGPALSRWIAVAALALFLIALLALLLGVLS